MAFAIRGRLRRGFNGTMALLPMLASGYAMKMPAGDAGASQTHGWLARARWQCSR